MRILLFLSLTLLSAASALPAQQPQIQNARVETRALQGSLEAQLRQFGAGPYRAGYAEPIIPGRHGDMCRGHGDNGNNGNAGDSSSGQQHAAGSPVRLEGQTALVVLVRVENGVVDKLRISSPDCLLDAGALPFYWLTGVTPEASVAWLKLQPDVLPPALHAGAAADSALEDLTAAGQPDKTRERAAFWLGSTRGAKGVVILQRMLAGDPSPKVREQVVFALSQSKKPAGLTTLMLIQNATADDPERFVKEQAVFALKMLPEAQGVPRLIDVAKNNRDLAVRRKALFWLGQSKDPRALDFFAQVLRQ